MKEGRIPHLHDYKDVGGRATKGALSHDSGGKVLYRDVLTLRSQVCEGAVHSPSRRSKFIKKL